MIQPTLNRQICPTCGQIVKLYARKLLASDIASLHRINGLSRAHPKRQYFHISEFITIQSGDFAKLRFWDFVAQKQNTDTRKRTSGYWRIKNDGVLFLKGKLTVPKYALFYNQKSYGLVGPAVNIRDCLKNYFDFQELLQDLEL